MKLSEAIRLGAMLRPQAFFRWFDEETGGSCALGAAGEAVGMLQYPQCYVKNDAKSPREWEWIRNLRVPCPACQHVDGAQPIIKHLNNDHRFSREAIADWIATLEPHPAIPPVDPNVRITELVPVHAGDA